MSINQLPQSTIKLITSSQVISSVSSAVKELIENSLDAGASNVDVKLDNYGLDRIEVKDDGAGISPSNAIVMGLPHYTSKISGFSDIESLESYGFRGEALNALCQVGNVTVTTATKEDKTGMIYVLDKSGQVTSSKPTHKVTGTSIVVSYLFKNIPVRRQFSSQSKRAKEELRNVEKIVKSLGVINVPVRFTLYHNKCMIWQKTSGTQLRQGMVCVVGYLPARELYELKTEGPEVKIEALVPRIGCDISTLSKGSSDWSMVFINKRPVQSKNIYKVVCKFIRGAFGEQALQRKSPVFVVSITVNPNRLDVNLEPNKTRVLLKDEDLLLEEVENFLAQYYGDRAANEESLESTAKKRKINHSEELAAKRAGSKEGNGDAEILEQFQKPPNEIPASRLAVYDKGTGGEINHMAGPPSKPCVVHTLGESIPPEKWSMGQVEAEGGTYYQGPAVLVPGQDTLPVKEKVQVPFAFAAMARDGQRSPLEERQTMEQCFKLEKQGFEKDWFPASPAEDSSKLFAPVESFLPPVVSGPEEPLVNLPAVGSNSKQPGPTVELAFPRNEKKMKETHPRNEKKIKGTLELAPRDDEFDMSVSSQMGRREFAGFTKYARETRPEIVLDNPGIAFTKVAVMLADKWKNLPTEQREIYEEKAREHSLARKQPQLLHNSSQSKLSFEQIDKPLLQQKSAQQKTTIDPSDPFKSHCFGRPQIPFRVSMDLIKARSQRPNRRETKERIIVVGQLQPSGGWLCLKGIEISLVNAYRLQEAVLTQRLLATHTIPLRPLSSPHRLQENELGADNWNLLLSLDRIPSDPQGKTMVLSSPIIAKNGFRIQFSETQGDTVVLLTHVADTISFYGIKDLSETLLLAATNGTSDLTMCRPPRVINHIKGEAVRICREDPPVMDRSVLEELLVFWEKHLSSIDLCPHSKPIWTPIHRIDAAG